MRYFATAAGSEREVALSEEGLAVDGAAPVAAELVRVPGSSLCHLRLGDRGHAFLVVRTERGWVLELAGRRLEVAVEGERARAIRELTGAEPPRAGGRELRAPMPGLVLRVQVEPGQRVGAGEPLVVIEAMKMENELRAEADATVAAVEAREGATVNQGDVLVTFEESPPE